MKNTQAANSKVASSTNVGNTPPDAELLKLARGMRNGEGDPETLSIMYPSATAGFPENIPAEMMEKALLRRVMLPNDHDSPFHYLIHPLNEKSDDTSQLHIPELLRDPSVKTWLHGYSYRCPSPYEKIRIPTVDDNVVTTFAYIVEKSSDSPNTSTNTSAGASDISSRACIDFIKSTFSTLARLAQDIHYEARHGEGGIVSFPLADGLRKMSNTFPPSTVFAINGNGSHIASASNSGEDQAERNSAQARIIAYNTSLIRLLVLLYAVPSSLSVDVRIWQLTSQLHILLCYSALLFCFDCLALSFLLLGFLNPCRNSGWLAILPRMGGECE